MFKSYYLFSDKNNQGVLLSDLKKLRNKTSISKTIFLTFKDKRRNSLFLNYTDDSSCDKDWQFLIKLERPSAFGIIMIVLCILVIAIALAIICHWVLTSFVKIVYALN
jgi:hypothetical protein